MPNIFFQNVRYTCLLFTFSSWGIICNSKIKWYLMLLCVFIAKSKWKENRITTVDAIIRKLIFNFIGLFFLVSWIIEDISKAILVNKFERTEKTQKNENWKILLFVTVERKWEIYEFQHISQNVAIFFQ